MKLPFLVRPSLQTEAVGDKSIGIIHFLQMGDVAVVEDPPSLQKRNDRVTEMILVLEDVTERIHKDLGVPLEYCRAKVYAAGAKRDSSAVESVTVKAVDGLILELESDQALAPNDWVDFNGAIAVVTELVTAKKCGKVRYKIADFNLAFQQGDTGIIKNVDVDSYLTKDERINQMKSQMEIPEIGIEAATLLIQNRVLYPVRLVQSVEAGKKAMQLMPLSIELQKGDRIKFEHKTVEVSACAGPTPYDIDVQVINVAPTQSDLKADSIGYVMRDGEYLRGAPDWTQEDTLQVGKKLVDAIYEFYKRERAAAPSVSDDDAPVEAGNGKNKQIASEVETP